MKSYDEVPVVYDDYKPPKSADGRVHLSNPHLADLESDTLYHLALGTSTHNLEDMFGDVKFVCMGGTVKRMHEFAKMVARELGLDGGEGDAPLVDLTAASNRYSMYKVGPVLSISHGMGVSSLSILMHEIIKLVYYAKCTNVVFFRIGTSGGIGVPQGTVVITQQAVDELLRPFYELHILGKIVRRPTDMNEELIEELKACENSDRATSEYQTVVGKTMCAMDFYEAQNRLDGAFCSFTLQEKMSRLKEISEAGVVNIEMEAITFASMCRSAGIPGAIVCVTLINRLEGDQVNTSKAYLEKLQQRPQELVLKFIKKRLQMMSNGVNGSTSEEHH
ncbi:PREDICTED: uridine phosphorylase 1-like [Rhagoletis zephyria]|uniref:uridine phosphorylase 1-like n=1 Tax=Rhagoletis zephyria TaxID=28612 RepID=UPI0008118100|nr:PREDICTED: uridine phosphorylase 1-like [Rhagoletis zephyria]